MKPPATLPDFRNLGVWLRILLLAQALRLAFVVLGGPGGQP